jgi:hypothetical protein
MRGQPFHIDPAGGLNSRDGLLSMEMQFSPDCLNVVGGPDGTIRKRNPAQTFSAALPGIGLNDAYSLHASPATTSFVAVGGGTSGKIYGIDINGVVTDITGAKTWAANSRWTFVDAIASGGQGPVFGIVSDDLASVPYHWTGAGNIAQWTASAGTLPNGKHMVYFKNRVIMCGFNVGSGYGIKASAVGDPRNWDTTVVGSASAWLTNIDPNDGEIFQALGVVGPYVLAFKAHKTYLIYDLNSGANRQISNTLGTISMRSVVNTPYGCCFVATDGHVYLTDGRKFDKLSDIVDKTPFSRTSMTLGETLHANTDPKTACVYFNNHLYVCNSPQYCLDYNFITKTWWAHSTAFWDAKVTAITNKTSELFSAYRGFGLAAGRVENLFVPNVLGPNALDPSGSYDSHIITIPLAPIYFRRRIFQDYMVKHRYHAVRFRHGFQLNLMKTNDFGNIWTSMGNYIGGAPTSPVEKTAYSLGVSNSLMLQFASNDGETPWVLYPFSIFTQPRTN